MNEGKEYTGTFGLDPALGRRFTLWVPFQEVRPTPHDIIQIISGRTGHARLDGWTSTISQLAQASEAVRDLPLDPLAFIYTVYLCSIGRCPHSPTGFHAQDTSDQLCAQTECRVRKVGEGFCPSVGGLPEGVAVFLKRAACALAALRAARTVRAVSDACEAGDEETIEPLRTFADSPRASGEALLNATVEKYVTQLEVSVQDVRALLPFAGLGGKIWLAEPYVAKQFSGSPWRALQQYARHTYASLEGFFRQNQALFQALPNGNGTIEKIKQRLEHAERFSDPAIRHAVEPLLDRYRPTGRGADQVAEEVQASSAAFSTASQLLRGQTR